jgi:hypothetical protein
MKKRGGTGEIELEDMQTEELMMANILLTLVSDFTAKLGFSNENWTTEAHSNIKRTLGAFKRVIRRKCEKKPKCASFVNSSSGAIDAASPLGSIELECQQSQGMLLPSDSCLQRVVDDGCHRNPCRGRFDDLQ